MRIKKILILVLALLLMTAMAACSPSEEASQEPSEDNKDSEQTEESLEPVTFTYFNAGTSLKDIEANQTRIGQIFEEQTGVNWKMEYLVGDINTKIGVMIASGEYPDVIVPDAAIDQLLDAGAFIPLNDLIEEHAPNLKQLYEPYLEMMKQPDGNIYWIPFGATHDYMPNPDIDQGAFWIQQDVLREFGYPEVKTLDEYFDLIIRYAEKYPEINGSKTVGFTALTYDWRFFAFTNQPNHLAGYPNDGGVIVDMDTYEAEVYADKEITKRWLKKLNEMNQLGLFDQEAFVANYDEYLAKLSSGRVLGFFDYGWQVGQAFNAIESAGLDREYRQYVPLPIVFDEEIKDQYLDPPGFVTNRGIGITVSAEDPVRIIKYIDNMAKIENQKLIMWGIEGETYEVDDNGRYYRTPEQIQLTTDQTFREEFGFAYFEWHWPRGNGTFPDGNAWEPRRQPEVARMSYTEIDLEFLDAYGLEVYADLFSAPDERPWFPAWSVNIEQGSPAQIFQQRSEDLQRQYFPQLVLASPDQFDSLWDEFVTEYRKLDVEAYEQTIIEGVKERVLLQSR
ncbi:putative aldouronate transport system substrate-binding protein [Caldalkalibacillus uzonensis]|uniref:Aldouronate transport system substrate-binding protein n=1 Tax=Caldalkalibacillus uzonensis TaxID=353224 RepID=A0ABU0CQA3_9BACI|nr:ABC transporter substrate-binding protein [Caldalkalibacillus uzonensis]MDQ0338593.1 putative aldouronate transport system substrate-binding protein [Caldalkalibacillus uzonensis]